MKISPKEIIETIESKITTVLSSEIVTYNYVSTLDQVDIDAKKNFPRVYFNWSSSGSLNENNNTVVITFMFVDVAEGKSDSVKRDYEIKSDMLQAASKFVDNLSREELLPDFQYAVSYDPLSGRYNNGLSGIQFSLTFAIEQPCYNI